VSESAVLPEPTAELNAPSAMPATAEEVPLPRKRQKRFRANLRFNALRYLTLGFCLLSVWGLFHAAMWFGTGKPEGTFMLVLAGGLLAAAGKTGIDILNWAEATRQATHLERVRAVQRLFDRAAVVREHALVDWRRIHTVLVDNLTGEPQKIRLFHDHDETDREGAALLKRALTEELWIGPQGVDACRQFKKWIASLDYDALGTEAEFLEAFNAQVDRLKRHLALAAIGVPLD
jgi:hypothetical protein